MSHTVPLSVRINDTLYHQMKELCSTYGLRPRSFLEEAIRRALEEFSSPHNERELGADLSVYRKAYADHLQHTVPYGPEDADVTSDVMAGLHPFLEATNERS